MNKVSLGDQALVWGTVLSVIFAGVGFTAWLTHVDYTATSAAQAQEKDHDILTKQLDEMNTRLSRIEGALGVNRDSK